MQDKSLFWHSLFYASLAVLTAWLILKVIGVIQTPAWLEYGVPAASLILSIVAFYQKILDSINKIAVGLATLTTRVGHLNVRLDAVGTNVSDLTTKVCTVTVKVDHVDKDVEILRNIA